MEKRLRILLLEDDPADAELIAQELKASGLSFSMERIETESDLRRELEAGLPELIISDHGFPSFDGFRALKIVREVAPDLPFIFVSGSNHPAMVARMHEEGATDYVFKNDLSDLRSAAHAALESPPAPVEIPPEPALPPLLAQAAEVVSSSLALPHVYFCPLCRRTRDESNVVIRPLDYFESHFETEVVRKVCPQCEPYRVPG